MRRQLAVMHDATLARTAVACAHRASLLALAPAVLNCNIGFEMNWKLRLSKY